MNKKNRVEEVSLLIKISQIFFGVAVFFIFAFTIIGQIVMPSERDVMQTDFQFFGDGWSQVLENGEKVPVSFPGKVDAEYGEVVTLTTTLPDDIYNGQNLCFRTVWQDAEVYIDGELRKTYSTEDTRPFGTNSAFRYVFVELSEEDAGKEVIYQFSSQSKYAGRLLACYLGDDAGIWGYLVKQSGMRALVAVFLMLMATCCIMICFFLKITYKKRISLSYLAWAIFLCATWMLSEIEFRQTIFSNVSILTNYTYWSLMLISIPMLLYVNDMQERYYQKFYIVGIIYSAIAFVLGTILQVFDVMQFVQELPFIHVGLLYSILCIIITISIDTVTKRIRNYFAVAIGVYGMLVTAIIELILYYIGTNVSLGTFLALGLIFLLITAIIRTGQEFLAQEKKKQQAIAAREAQATFLANMSHEIRTPINAVLGMNEMILRENEDEKIREYAYNIKSASNMLLGLVNDILDFSKIESGQFELVEDTYHLATLLQDELVLLNARISGKPLTTQLELDPNIPSMLYGDELRIKQILTNLLSNAAKYTKEGTITLKGSYTQENEDTILLTFSVIDTGIGIKKDDLSKLFDSFKRLELSKNRNIEGTGLGLNIVKQLVELMNGTITVTSEYGKGSNFTISIPQKVMDKKPMGTLMDALQEKKKDASTEHFTAPDASVLVVDDNNMNLSLMKELLKRAKFKVDLADSGKECLRLTKEKQYHIILMDHMMPEMDGVETLQMLRADNSNPNKDTVVIALTANATAGSRENYLEYGFNDYISKPIQADKLDAMLVQYLPRELVKKQSKQAPMGTAPIEQSSPESQSSESDLLYINKEAGISYCLDSADLYVKILSSFYTQAQAYLPQLDMHFENRDWKQYAIIVHSLKANTLNIGAANFSKLSLQHELAAKREDEAFIVAEYENYITILKKLIQQVENMI